MAKLTKAQIDELKNRGFITAVEASDALANQSVDELKEKEYVTQVVPSTDLETAVTPNNPEPTLDPKPEE